MNAPLTKEQIALLMSGNVTHRTPAVETARPAAPSLFTRLKLAITHLLELPHRRAVLDELSTLTDRELADIGLNRAELGQVFDPRFAQARVRGTSSYGI